MRILELVIALAVLAILTPPQLVLSLLAAMCEFMNAYSLLVAFAASLFSVVMFLNALRLRKRRLSSSPTRP